MTGAARKKQLLEELSLRIAGSMQARDWPAARRLIQEALALHPADEALLWQSVELEFNLKRWRAMFRAWINVIEKLPIPEPKVSSRRPYDGISTLSFFFAGTRFQFYSVVFLAVTAGIAAAAYIQWGVAAALLSAAGMIFGTVGAEIAYRMFLYSRHGIKGETLAYPGKTPKGLFTASNKISYVPHAQRGYDMVPDTSFVRIVIDNGRVVEAHTATTDANGNVGFTDTATEAGALNILVLGDSYTSFPGNGATVDGREGVEWPYFMKRALAAAGIGNVRVLNYARSGHGVRQMIDTAAGLVDRHQFDFVIVAYIGDDLDRYRMWFEARNVGGVVRSFRCIEPGAPLEACAEQDIIDERITLAWAQERLARRDSDRLLSEIVATYNHRIRRSSSLAADLLSPRRLYSWDTLFFGTPFIDRKLESSRVVWQKSLDESFGDDPQFVAAVNKIQDSGARLMLCWIPRKGEMIKRRPTVSKAAQASLLKDLQRITGVSTQGLPELYTLDPALVEEKFARRPHDEHPSLWAQEQIGLAVARAVRKEMVRLARDAKPSI